MKRNSFKKLAALSLSLMFCAISGTSAFATGNTNTTGGGTINGESTVAQGTFSVIFPTNISFLLDPMKTYSANTTPAGLDVNRQIRMGTEDAMLNGYAFVNTGNVPISLTVDATMTLGTGVYLMAQQEVNVDDPLNKDKEAYFSMVPAASAGTTVTDAGDVTAAAFTTAAAISPNTTASGKAAASMNFVLNKWDTANNKQAAGDTGVAVFAFEGRLNPIADWKKNDLKVALKYTFTGMTADMYTAAYAGRITSALNLTSAKSSDVAFTSSASPSIDLDPVIYSGVSTIVPVSLGSGNKAGNTVNAIRFYKGGVGVYTAVSTDYSFNSSAKVITLNAGKFTTISAGTGYQMEVSFTNGKKAITNFTKQ